MVSYQPKPVPAPCPQLKINYICAPCAPRPVIPLAANRQVPSYRFEPPQETTMELHAYQWFDSSQEASIGVAEAIQGVWA